MAVEFEDFAGGEAITLGDELNNKLNALKNGVNLALQYRGDYDAEYSYDANDIAAYASSKWLALAPSLGVTPTEGASWTMFGGGGTGTGSAWTIGSGAPNDGDGSDGDFYIDEDTYDVYRKAGGTWSQQLNIKGAPGTNGTNGTPGAPGSQILFGSGAPDDALGSDGYTYVDEDGGGVYYKVAGAWQFRFSIIGPQGIPGGSLNPRGAWASASAYEVDDDVQHGSPVSSYRCYVAHTSGSSTEPGVGASWQDVWILYAQAGATGATGASGTAGAQIYNSTDVPNNANGNNGDWHVRTSTADFYKKIAGAWTQMFNAKGLKGDKGDTGAKGDAGESAYAIAVANGFAGTVAEWLASLVGPQGEQGEPGTPGSGIDAETIQGRAMAATAPSDGQAIVWDGAGNTWKPGTVSGGGGSGGSGDTRDFWLFS